MKEKRILGDWLNGYMHYTEDSEPPTKFHEWMGVATVAAALQRKCRIRWGSITFFPNFFIVLVSPPGQARKGTAMGFSQKFLEDQNIPMASDATSLQALIKRMSECTESSVDIEEGIYEAHSSLTAFSPELTVFLGFADKELISNMCDFYDCRQSFKYETISRGVEEVVGVYLNLVGATTPDLIHSSMNLETIGSGLTSRMIFIFEPKIRKRVVCPFYTLSEEGEKLNRDLTHDLTQIRSLRGDFKVSKSFIDLWTEWYGNYPDESPNLDPTHFGGYWERRPAHIMKLAMVMSASRSNSMIMDRKDLERALALLESTEVNMPQVFRKMGQSDQSENIQRVMNFIVRRGKMTMRDLMKEFLMFLSEDEMNQILGALRQADFIMPIAQKGGDSIIEHKKPSPSYVQNSNKGENA